MNKRVRVNLYPLLDVQIFPFAQAIKFGMSKRVLANQFPFLDAKKLFVNLQTRTGILHRVRVSCLREAAEVVVEVAVAVKTIQ